MDKRKLTSAKNGKKGGRPKGSLAAHTLERQEFQKRYIERVMPVWDDIIDAQIEKASLGSERMLEEINNRVLGKSIQPLGTPDDDGNILPFQIVITQTSGNNSSSTVSKAV